MCSAARMKIVAMGGVLAALIISLGLAACGGGGGGTAASAIPGTPGVVPPVVPPLPPTCSTTSGPLTLSFSASRLTGVAPLAVFFDATASTSSNPIRPFHELEYRWAFDSTGVAPTTFWATGSRAGASAKNVAMGPIAAHVFEVPGTYTIALSITDGTSTVTNNCATITVQDPNVVYGGANTTCVASGSTPVAGAGGCPAGAAVANNSDFDAALATFFGAGKRVLFNGGDTFTASVTTTFSGVGPAEVGAYGAGRPIVQWTGATVATGFLRIGGTGSDFRIVNIEFDGQNQAGQFPLSFQNSAWTNLLLLNNYFHSLGGGLGPDWAASGGSGFYMFGNRSENPAPTMTSDGVLVGSGAIVAIIGNNFDNNGVGQQAIRVNHMNRFVVSNNSVAGVVATKASIDIRSADTITTQYGVVSNNSVTQGDSAFGINPSSGATNLGIFDLIIEGNYVVGVATGQINTGVATNAERITIRNNIIDASSVDFRFGIVLRGTNGGFSLPSKDVWVYNNSIFSSKAAGTLTGISVDTDVGIGNEVKNNLVYTSVIAGTVISDAGSLAAKSNNTGDVAVAPGVVTLNPNWTITVPMTPLTNFQPGPGSYAIDKGAVVPVFSDFFGVARSGLYDLGAVNP